MKHPHHDIIIAWLNGADVEFLDPAYENEWCKEESIESCQMLPCFFREYKYRIVKSDDNE